jgi:hypothetical protein
MAPGSIRSVVRALTGLRRKALATLTARSPCPVATYLTIRRSVAAANLLDDAAEPVRRSFNAYYGVRRNAVWRAQFYARFQAAKASPLKAPELFEDVLARIQADTGRVEASFASKLVATLRPDAPIIDSVVRGWLAKYSAPPPFGGGIDAAVEYYRWLNGVFGEAVTSPEARDWGRVFTNAFPFPPGEDPVSATKQLDFLIWAGADR